MNTTDNKIPCESEKVFLDATMHAFFNVVSYEFTQLLVWLVLIGGGSLYLVIKSVLKLRSSTPLNIEISLAAILTILIASFIVIRRYSTFKVITSSSGLILIGLLKKKYIDWKEITEISTAKMLLPRNIADGAIGTIATLQGKYFFPLTMREENNMWPQIKGQLMNFAWIEANGTTKDITLSNCPLYQEIQKHLTLIRPR